jgi:hypothetical protein
MTKPEAINTDPPAGARRSALKTLTADKTPIAREERG